MTEQQSTPQPQLPEASPQASQSAGAAASQASYTFTAPDGTAVLRRRQRAQTVVLLLVIAGLGAQWWVSHTELRDLRSEVAQRLQSGDNSSNELKGVLKAVQESTKELQAKVSVLDSKQAESQSQQLALEQMYQDLNKNRDDWALTEIEEVLSTADQQLELAGNVPGALIALQNADKSLSRSDKPQFIAIRRAIARDIERLKALPTWISPASPCAWTAPSARSTTCRCWWTKSRSSAANPQARRPPGGRRQGNAGMARPTPRPKPPRPKPRPGRNGWPAPAKPGKA
jgi:uroporphyrin-3 C-methyltransferase/uroporphyrinogen III methyltransferase/synthase